MCESLSVCPLYILQYVHLNLSTHILHFLSHHLAVSVHPALLQSAAIQFGVPTLFLIEAAECVSMFASHYYSHPDCVIGSCFICAFYMAVYHSCSSVWYSFTVAMPGLVMCFLCGNAVY